MNVVGNICLTLAGILYLMPLQYLALEMSRKRDDGGGAIAAILILAPLWLLLLVALLTATSRGAFDMLPLKRSWLYPLVISATLAFGVWSFVSLAALYRPTWTVRLLLGWEVFLLPLLTIVVVACALNPGLAAKLPVSALRWTWIALAGLAVIGGLAQIGITAIRAGSRQVQGIVHAIGGESALRAEHLVKVNALDPERGFSELVGYSTHFYSEEVQAAAVARARSHPRLAEAITLVLQGTEPMKPLQFLRRVELTDEERRQLAAPARDAIHHLAEQVHRELRYTPPDRLKFMRSHGGETCRAVAAKLSGCGVDFAPALAAFTQAFTPDES